MLTRRKVFYSGIWVVSVLCAFLAGRLSNGRMQTWWRRIMDAEDSKLDENVTIAEVCFQVDHEGSSPILAFVSKDRVLLGGIEAAIANRKTEMEKYTYKYVGNLAMRYTNGSTSDVTVYSTWKNCEIGGRAFRIDFAFLREAITESIWASRWFLEKP